MQNKWAGWFLQPFTMMRRFSRAKWGSILVAVVWIGCWASAALAQAPQGQQAGEAQPGPVTEPRSAEHKPSGPPIPKGLQAIKRTEEKCSTQLTVNANALFGPGRWSLNPDAPQTLNALGPLIAQAGKHPVRIKAFSGSDATEKENQFVAQSRALTVRTWLRNNGFIPEETPMEGIGTFAPGGEAPKEPIQVIIDKCKPMPAPQAK